MSPRIGLGLCLSLGLILPGCGGTRSRQGLGAEGDYLHCEQLYEGERYFQAVQCLDSFLSEHPGSDRVDDAIYFLGKSHQGLGEQVLALQQFDRLLQDFPQSDRREAAEFEKAMSHFSSSYPPARDPEPTLSAVEGFRAYLRHYPDGVYRAEAERLLRVCLDKLARKAYLNGRTYEQLGHPSAARIYYEKSLEILSDSSSAGQAHLGLARSYQKEGDEENARAAYRRFLEFANPDRLQQEPTLRSLREEAEKALARLEATGKRN